VLAYLIPELKRWSWPAPSRHRGWSSLASLRSIVSERGPIDADKLLRNILRRALRKAGLPPLRFYDMQHLAGTLMSEAGVPPKRASSGGPS
jgi:hypothetical protein